MYLSHIDPAAPRPAPLQDAAKDAKHAADLKAKDAKQAAKEAAREAEYTGRWATSKALISISLHPRPVNPLRSGTRDRPGPATANLPATILEFYCCGLN